MVPGPIGLLRRLGRLLSTLGNFLRPAVCRRRLRRLEALGLIDAVPTPLQVLVAGHHQMLGTASDETRVFYARRGIPFGFHNLRRFLDEPASMADPVGFFSEPDAIIHHIFQSTHHHAIYDMQLLRMVEGGVEELVRQWAEICAGRHPRQARYEHLVEDPTYWDRLRWQIPAFVDGSRAEAEAGAYAHVDGQPLLQAAMDQFKDVRGFCAYAARLDVRPLDLVHAYVGELLAAALGEWGWWGRRQKGAIAEHLDPDIRQKWVARAGPHGG